jgi:hypothetical protein
MGPNDALAESPVTSTTALDQAARLDILSQAERELARALDTSSFDRIDDSKPVLLPCGEPAQFIIIIIISI